MHTWLLQASWERKLRSAVCLPFYFLKDFIYLLLERGKGKKKERERNKDVRGKHRLVAFRKPPTRDPAATQAHALTGN